MAENAMIVFEGVFMTVKRQLRRGKCTECFAGYSSDVVLSEVNAVEALIEADCSVRELLARTHFH